MFHHSDLFVHSCVSQTGLIVVNSQRVDADRLFRELTLHHPVSAADSHGDNIRDCFSWTSEGIRSGGTRLGRRDQMEDVGRQEGRKKEKEVRQKKAEEKQKRKEEVKDRNTNVTVDSSNDIPSNTDVMAVDPSFLSDRDSLALLETSLTMIILR